MYQFSSQEPPREEVLNEATEKIKMIIDRTIMESRKSKRESFIGSNRKRVFDESVGTPNTNLFMDDYIKKSIDDYFEQMRRDNEAEYIPPTDEELEYLVQLCRENMREDQLAEEMIREEHELMEHYVELENSLHDETAFQQYKASLGFSGNPQ